MTHDRRSGSPQYAPAMRIAALTAVLLAIPGLGFAQLRAEVVASGFTRPVGVVADPMDPAVLFVVEQSGTVKVVRDGHVLDRPFLELRDQLSDGGERGLLGLAFDPAPDSRRFFVNFTNQRGDTVIARFTRSEHDPLLADAESRFDLLWPSGRRYIEQPFSNHNGGHLAFGPDGYLYIGMGDGGSGGDPQNHAQNPRSLLGKMLRIDVALADDHPHGYHVPNDNPFVDGEPVGALHEIWAFGLRNPWQFSFDDPSRGGVGALLIADVGQNAREEINFEPRGRGGRNYGWRLREARRPYDERGAPAFGPLTDPVHEYDRTRGASVTGGYIYRGTALPAAYHGRYFYADFVDGRVYSIGVHLDDQGIALAPEIDIGEQAGAEQVLQRLVDPPGIERIAGIDLHVGPDGFRLDALIALDSDLLDRVARGNRLGECRRHGQAQGAEKHPCDERKPLYKRHLVSTP